MSNDTKASAQLQSLLHSVTEQAIRFVESGEEANVIDYQSGHDLTKILSLQFPHEGVSQEDFLLIIQKILDNSVNPWGGRFLDKLYASTNPVGVVSELVLGLLNANSHVYRTSPALTIIEIETSKRLASLYGLGDESGGVTMPGGSASNRLALTTAINTLLPTVRNEGIASLKARPVIFTSSHSHYSIEQAACTSGLGLSSVRKVATDESGRMLVSDLQEQLERAVLDGEQPIFINATAGTTVTGAFDPIRQIAALGKKHHCWVHVDGSWGGPLIFSRTYRHYLDGIDLADSITVNPHKLLAVPLQCSFLLLKQREKLRANHLGAAYLFHGNEFDLGDGTTGCGRRPDAFKMFLAWQSVGSEGFGRAIDNAMRNSSRLASLISAHPNLELLLEHDPASPRLQVCFRYVPSSDSMRGRGLVRRGSMPTPPHSSRDSSIQAPREREQLTQEVYQRGQRIPDMLFSQLTTLTPKRSRSASLVPRPGDAAQLGEGLKGAFAPETSTRELDRIIHRRLIERGKVMVDLCPINSIDVKGNEIGDVFRVPMHPNVPFSTYELLLREVLEVGEEIYK